MQLKPIAAITVLLVVVVLVSISGCTSSNNAATATPTAAASTVPTAKPTVKPTAKPTVKPTAKPTVKPTAKITPTPSVSQTIQLVGDSATHVYHLQSCRYVPKISPSHLVYFNSAAEAKAAGYRPCKVCNPPDP